MAGKPMKFDDKMKSGVKLALIVGLAGAVSGCFGPTYGTGKTSGAQLMEDLGDSLSLGKKNRTRIEYAPRP
ncbi:MAG: hypothetical protein AAGF25_12555, partial [Pseudomonadota bacterium]